jgi:hypothetical protein
MAKKKKGPRVIVAVKHGKVGARSVTYERELIRCGNKRCGACPHGPYWYAVWRSAQGELYASARVRRRYIGKVWRALTVNDATRSEKAGKPAKRKRGRK